MKVISKKISELHSDPGNVRRHPEENIKALKASLARFGQQKPIVIDESNVVRAGNGTLQAAIELGFPTIDCVVSTLANADLVAYAIADNRTAELATWDTESLKATLATMGDDLELLAATGFGALDKLEEEALSAIEDSEMESNNQIKNLVLPYKAKEHSAIATALVKVCEEHSLESFSDAVKFLIEAAGYKVSIV